VLIGESGLGKTTFINTLFTTTIKEHKNQNKRHAKQTDKTVEIEITKAGECCDRYGGEVDWFYLLVFVMLNIYLIVGQRIIRIIRLSV